MRNLLIAIAFFLATIAGGAARGVEYVFEEILVPGSISTGLIDINNLNQYIGTYSSPDGARHAFVFDGEKYVTFEYPGADSTTPTAINDHGVIAGHYEIGDSTIGFLFDDGEFTSISLPGAQYTQFRGLNNAGQIVGVYQRADFSGFGFSMEPDGSYQELMGPGGEHVSPMAIANDGAILASIAAPSNEVPRPRQGLLIDGPAQTLIPRFGNYSLHVEDLTDDQIVVGWRDGSQFALIMSGFVVEGDEISYVDIPDSHFMFVLGVNNAGVLAGSYTTEPGEPSVGFLAQPIPEPDSAGLVFIGLSLLVCHKCVSSGALTLLLRRGTLSLLLLLNMVRQ